MAAWKSASPPESQSSSIRHTAAGLKKNRIESDILGNMLTELNRCSLYFLKHSVFSFVNIQYFIPAVVVVQSLSHVQLVAAP